MWTGCHAYVVGMAQKPRLPYNSRKSAVTAAGKGGWTAKEITISRANGRFDWTPTPEAMAEHAARRERHRLEREQERLERERLKD